MAPSGTESQELSRRRGGWWFLGTGKDWGSLDSRKSPDQVSHYVCEAILAEATGVEERRTVTQGDWRGLGQQDYGQEIRPSKSRCNRLWDPSISSYCSFPKFKLIDS